MKSNINLSFNNSFNTNIAEGLKSRNILKGESTLTPDGVETIKYQAISSELQQNLKTELLQNEGNQSGKLTSAVKTFDDVIQKDPNFSCLLLQIKNVYTDFISNLQSKSAQTETGLKADLEAERLSKKILSE